MGSRIVCDFHMTMKMARDVQEETPGTAFMVPLSLLALLLAFSYKFTLTSGIIRIFADLGIIYLYLFFAGIGWYYLVTPRSLMSPLLLPFLPPLYTMSVFSIINVYVMLLNKNAAYTLYGSLLTGGGSILLALLLERINIADHVSKVRQTVSTLLPLLLSTVILIAIILTPILRAGFPTTPYRLNVDQAGYAQTAQFLLEGGTLKKVAEEIKHEIGATNLRETVKADTQALNLNVLINALFFLRVGTRTGYISMLSAYALITRSSHVLQVQFLSLAISYGLLFGILFCCLFLLLEFSDVLALSISAAMALNANLLNAYYEGLNVTIFFMPFLAALFFEYGLMRQSGSLRQPGKGFANILSDNGIKPVFFLSLLLSVPFSAYGEGALTILALFLICLVLDCLFKKRIDFSSLFLPLSAAVLTCALISPQIYHHFKWSLAFLSERNVQGFWHPHWASPAEIVGIFNMYASPYINGMTGLMTRNSINTFINAIVSLVLLAFVLSYLRTKKNLDTALWLAAPVFVLVSFLETRYVSMTFNYIYTKAFTILLPFLLAITFGAVSFFMKSRNRAIRTLSAGLMYFAFSSIALNGFLFIQQYCETGKIVTRDMFNLHEYNVANGNVFDSYAFITNKANTVELAASRADITEFAASRADITEFMLIPLLPMRWLNQGPIKKNIVPHLDRTVAVIIRKDTLHDKSAVENHRKDIIYENSSFAFLNTRKKVAAFCNPASGTCDVSVYAGEHRDLFQ